MLIGARQTMWQKRGSFTASSYVQDSLVNMIDGIENGGFGIHNEGVATEFPIVDCVTSQQYTSDHALLCASYLRTKTLWGFPRIAVALNNLSSYTIEMVVHFSFNGANGISFVRGSESDHAYYPYVSAVGTSREQGFIVRSGDYNSTVQVLGYLAGGSSDVVLYTTFTMSPTANTFYWASGESVKNTKTSVYAGRIFPFVNSSISFSDQTPVLDDGARQCRLFAVRAYNRALTPAEVAHNYAIDRVRFTLQ